MDMKDYDAHDPDRHLKRIQNVMGVTIRVQKIASKKRKSVKLETEEERIDKLLKAAKDDRAGRNLQIGENHRYVLEMASFYLNVDKSVLLDSAIDSSENIKVLRSLFEVHGSCKIVIQCQLTDPPSMASGRYDPKQKQKTMVALFSEGQQKKIIGKCVTASRKDNLAEIQFRMVAREISFTLLEADVNVIASIDKGLVSSTVQSLRTLSHCTSSSQAKELDFRDDVDKYENFLKRTKIDIVECAAKFDVNNDLFKGSLLVPHQIEETSKRREKVAEVEKAFHQWMNQIKVVVSQGHQFVQFSEESGPKTELEHWQKMQRRFVNVLEFTDSKPFQNYLECMKLSRSKLVGHWKEIEDSLVTLLNEARDNVKFMGSVEKFWEPLYRFVPAEIAEGLGQLLQAVKTVYTASKFFNTNVRVAGFLSKVINQLIKASQKYLTEDHTISVWSENITNLVKKIDECKKLREAFRVNFVKILQEMEDAGQTPFICSEKFLFEPFESFELRMDKICNVMEVCMRYRVLDKVRIVGMEPFSESIKSAFAAISKMPYDPLAHRLNEFEKDYTHFQREVLIAEKDMKNFLKKYVEKIECVEMQLITLKRFDRLNLKCLHMDRRYLDVAVMLQEEIHRLTDTYSEERGKPPHERNIPPAVGRIRWARCLKMRMEEPLNVLKNHECVIIHPKAQTSVKLFNFMSEILYHFEAIHHKAWFNYVSQVRSKLETPLIRKNPETNHYEINLDEYVPQALKETKSMMVLGLEVPDDARTLMFCQEAVMGAFNATEELIERNNELRLSIYPMFLPLMRVQLINLEKVFAPLLSTVTWLSQNIENFFERIDKVLTPIEGLVKEITDLNNLQIDVPLEEVATSILVALPDEPVSHKELKEMNVAHRQKMEKRIEMKSLAAEKASVNLINKLVEKSGLPTYDNSGKFQLPAHKLNEDNRRVEEHKPLTKYDWLSFEKLYKPVGYPSPEENQKLCFKDHSGLNYDVILLHIDCVELFAYYNHKVIAALVNCSKRSMEIFKKRSNISSQIQTFSCFTSNERSMLKASIHLLVPNFKLVPSIDELQQQYDVTLLNIIETHYAVTTWGKQAKTEERKKARTILEEVKHERNFFKLISEHKDVSKYKMSFQNGLKQLEGTLKEMFTGLADRFCFLWSKQREEEIEAFVQQNPLTADIKDKLNHYDQIIDDISKLTKVVCMGTIEINREQMIDALLEEAMKWKTILGQKLSVFYGKVLDEMVNFIQAQQKTLSHDLVDLEDCRNAMNCMKVILDNFYQIDQTLNLVEETYAMFASFQISISAEDIDRVYGLRYRFNTMMDMSQSVHAEVLKLQEPLQKELDAGVKQFKEDLDQYDDDFDKQGPMMPGISAKEASDRVLLFDIRLQNLTRQFEIYSSGEILFGLPVNEYPVLQKRRKDINYLNKLYKLYLDVMRSITEYSDTLFENIDMVEIVTEIQEFVHRCRVLPKGMKNWPAFIDLKQKIDDFNETVPMIELMVSNAIKNRHWEMLENLMSWKFDKDAPNFTLGLVLQAPLLSYKEDVEEICIGAIKELDIEQKLQAVVKEWKEINIPLAPFKSREDTLIKASDVQEILTKLEDTLMLMSSLAVNRFNAPFKQEIMTLLHRLSKTSEILENWLQVQFLWIYLEAVFVSGDIAEQLPMEAKRFANIDKAWVSIMSRARNTQNVLEICTGDDIVEVTLKHLIEQLEACQKSLTSYLEMKRLIFPRFFFVSDPVLLEILAQSSNPTAIQPHLLSIFDGVAKVEFSEKSASLVVAMKSSNGERVPLLNPVKCSGNVEVWIGRLLEAVQETMRSILGNLSLQIGDPKFNYKTKLEELCGQAQLICIQLLWTRDAEFALTTWKVDKKIMFKTNQAFQEMLDYLVDQTVKDLTMLQRISCETLVTIHVHQRDIFEELLKNHIRSTQDFDWQKQGRFYYDYNEEEVVVRITNIDFVYQNEYLGVTERLAITPLTDRCYITLAQAIGMYMGGAPAGPAGTGKTETTKDMGRALGKLVVVFNCSDQMDFRGLGRIFKGLAQSGSWGCFDEFNRIELPVLSVAAQQIYIVLNAKKEKRTEFLFSDGDIVKLNPEFGIFITMNPGYAGRQELPENLKIQFRTVAMMVPDRQIIIRVKLASCGFRDNVNLSAKFFTLYKLCEEQLSKQVHYDFGLRNMLSCLRTLGAVKRAATGKVLEEEIVMQVLRDMNLSKLVDEDEPLFLSLISDLFPQQKLQTPPKKELQVAISRAAGEMGLMNDPSWNLKIVQLYETSLVRHGLMVMGPTGAGKTKCINCLLQSLTIMGLPHKEIRMNPKAITAPQMFGKLDVTTNDWTDGIFSVLWRRTLKFKNDFVWLVLDGPVDAVWIENLNSVLDDNKTLTLANGDRILMSPNCKLVFEPDAIDNASPATVSRMGMVFMSSSVMPWTTVLGGWLLTRPTDQQKSFKKFFDKIYGDLHLFVQTKLQAKMNILEAMYIHQTCDLLVGLLDQQTTLPERHLEKIFMFAVMWSLGAILELDDREKMETFVQNHPSKMQWPKCAAGESIFEFLVDSNGQWQHWSTQIEEYIYPSESIPEYSSILVPNVDNVRTAYLIETIAKQKKSVLLIGEQGTAKTVMIKSFMSGYDPEVHMSKSFNFSSATTPGMFQRIIESYVEKRVGMTFGPPQQRQMTIFIDDVNMPLVNEWGDQVTNEIVRQLMDCKGFYSLDRPGDFANIQDIQLLAAMIHPGGGRNDIPPRLKRQFNIFNCTLPSNKSMDKIFNVIGCGYFCSSRFNSEVVEFVPQLVTLTRMLWQQTKTKMLPTPAKFHYVFNLRDLSRMWEGMLKIEKDQCQTVNSMLKLWRHESTRVIADRFTNFNDRKWFSEKINELAMSNLGDFKEFYSQEETYFVDFLRDQPDVIDDDNDDAEIPDQYFVYEEIPSFDEVKERVLGFMAQYNLEVRGSKLDLVFFEDALIHLMIVSRILRTPRGNAMLVGVGGSGKQSLTKLVSYIAGYKTHQITLTRAYNNLNFADEFKYLYRVAGLKGQGISFIFADNDIKDESFLEYLNNVLSSGEIANLFTKEEIDEITDELIPIMKKVDPRRPATQDNLYDFFITRARSNLHIVLCFSPVGEKFRNRSLKFPGLISGCMVDWFQKWPKDALQAVSSHFLSSFDVKCSHEVKQELIDVMAFIQDDVSSVCVDYFARFRRQTHVTPKSFLTFLAGYKTIYKSALEHINSQSERMTNGLDKLQEAAVSIEILKKEFEVKKQEILQAELAAHEVIENVAKTRVLAETAKEEVAEKQATQAAFVEKIVAAQVIAERELAKTIPELMKAEAALKTVGSRDIAVVRRLGKPPHLITVIMDAVLVLLRKKLDPVKLDTEKSFLVPSWVESVKLMSEQNFLKKVVEFETDSIDAETVDLLQPYFNFSNYNDAAAKVACGSVSGLLSWTIAMADFYKVNKDVLPLKADLAMKQAQAEKANLELQTLEATLAEKETEVKTAEQEYDIANEALQKVKDEASLLQSKLDAAQSMITGLSSERSRWTEQVNQFTNETTKLVGDSIILTGFLSYTGPFNQEFRALLQKTWLDQLITREIPFTSTINITEKLTDAATIGEWNLQGLPNDELSVQNGIIVTQGTRYPLLIDPQSQGKAWIVQKEKDNELVVTSLTHKFFRNHLEDAIQQGWSLLIEDVGEELDPCMDNVLEKNYIKIGNSYKVKVGDKEIDTHPHFRMFITTKLPNPMYTPEIAARTSIIDFTVTMKGLEDQLLSRVILSERREIESERIQLEVDVTTNKKLSKELEANLLHKLSTTQGSLLDDISVMEVLNASKAKASEIEQKLESAEVAKENINRAREEFRAVATRGSVLYFLIVKMTNVNNMYQTSLGQFLERFDHSLENSDRSPITYKRIQAIIEHLTFDILKYTSRGLYETHKFLFVLLMTLDIDLQRGSISFQEFQNFIKGGATLDITTCPEKPAKWITDPSWLNLVQLSTMRPFHKILNQLQVNEKAWKQWYDKSAPEEEFFPDGYNTLDHFRKLLIIRSFCPDRTLSQSSLYIASSIGAKFAQPVVLNYDEMLEESRSLTPIICFLSMGSDPTTEIEALAKKNQTRVKAISMGQGQEVHARKLMRTSLEEGSWVMLQNCHLGLDYMNELTNLLVTLEKAGKGFHEMFRLWITTEPHPHFPISLLQMSIKFTNEPPSGVRAGLKRTFSSMSDAMLDHSDSKFYMPLIYAVSFLHTIVQERRKFGALGWNIPYEFNSSDWLSSCYFIQKHLDELTASHTISWKTVNYMIGEVQYGGRVTDDYDKRLLNCFAKTYFNNDMFSESFEFFRGYKIVTKKSVDDYDEYFETMNVSDPPNVYGLHSNADLTYQTNKTKEILDTIISVQPKESSGAGGESRETTVTHQVDDMLRSLPALYDEFEVKTRLTKDITPMNIFLRQEIDRIQKTILLVKSTLNDLLLAIEGTIIMNEQLRDAFDNIYDARVPKIWLRGSWLSSTLGFWFTELIERNKQFSDWCFKGRPNVYWMAGFFNPQGFLTAMRQEMTRAQPGWALDKVFLQNEVMKFSVEDAKEPPKLGVYVHGLYLDGAGWSRKEMRLAESGNKVLYTLMPVIRIYANDTPNLNASKQYECPVYKKANRTGLNFITALTLPTIKPPNHWVLRGVALLCDIK